MNSNPLRDVCERNLGETIEFLRQMVGINSYTSNAEGINQLGALTASYFAPLGFAAEFTASKFPGYGSHLILQRPFMPGRPSIALISHLDTVYSAEEEALNNFRWRRDGERIYGPGTNDIKGGTALIHLLLVALRKVSPQVFEETNWFVLLNACEEMISAEFGELCSSTLPKDTRACLVFEADGGTAEELSLVRARKGRSTFRVEVSGRGAHAGSQHHRGANAVVQLAQIITSLDALTDYEQMLTVNVGMISGGSVPNRVPHHACAELEMRAFDLAAYHRACDVILGWNGEGTIRSRDADQHACRITVVKGDETRPWPRNAGTEGLLKTWTGAAADLGLRLGSQERGGLSDGNVLWDSFPTLDGLGPRGENSHCSEQSADGTKEQEWVDVSSFVPKTVLNATAVIHLLRETAGK